MVAGGIGHRIRQAGGLCVIAAHGALQFGELAHHRGTQVEFCDPRRLFGQRRVRPHRGRDLARQCGDAFHPVGLRPQLGVEGHGFQPFGPVLHPRAGFAQVVVPEERGVRQPRGQHALVAVQDSGAVVRGLDIGDGDIALDPARPGVAGREELLVLAHRGLQHFGRQVEETLFDHPHQRDGPFDQTGQLGHQPLVGDDFPAAGKGEIGGLLPDRGLTLGWVKHDLGAQQLGRVIVKAGNPDRVGGHEAVAARGVAGGDAVHGQRHGLRPRRVGQDAQDSVQRPHPAQAAAAPAHRLGPWKIADRGFQNLGHDLGGAAAGALDDREIRLALFLGAALQLVQRQAGRAQETLDRLFGRVRAGALAFLAHGFGFRGQPLDRQHQPARRRKRPGRYIGQPGLDQPVGDQAAQILARARLHPCRDFLGKQLDQQVHQSMTPRAGFFSLNWCQPKARPSG